MNDTIRRFLRGTCWVLALIVFVVGFGANIFAWVDHRDMPYGVVDWAVASIIVLVLVGYWVGPLDSRTLGRIAAQIEALQADRGKTHNILEGLLADARAAAEWRRTAADDIIERISAIEKRFQGAEVGQGELGLALGRLKDDVRKGDAATVARLGELLARVDAAIVKADAEAFVDARSEAEHRASTGASVMQFPAQKWPQVTTRKDDHS